MFLMLAAAALPFEVPSYSSNCTVEWLRYGSHRDESRREIFCSNLARISAHNQRAEEFGYSLKIGPFAANTTEEMRHLLGNPHPLNYSDPRVNVSAARLSPLEAGDVDWRSRMGPVKDQGHCGSCWVRPTAARPACPPRAADARTAPDRRPPRLPAARSSRTHGRRSGLLGDRRRRL